MTNRRRYVRRTPAPAAAEPQQPATLDPVTLDPATAVAIGRISSAHGVHGELNVQLLTDFPSRFDAGTTVWLDGAPRMVERNRHHDRFVVIKLAGVDTRDAAEALRGHELMAPEARVIEDEGRYYLHDIIGLEVVDAAGETLGRVSDVFATGANDVYVVHGDRGELLLPAIEDVVREVDVAAGRILVELLPGLEFQAPRRSPGRRPPRPQQDETPG